MAEDRLITVAIHTYEKATILKSILENEGIEVALHNVNLIQPVVSSGVRIRIHEKDLPLALRIIENAEIFKVGSSSDAANEAKAKIIVPVDFSEHSIQACRMAFQLADSLDATVLILHTFLDPYISTGFQLTDAANYTSSDSDIHKQVEEEATRRLNNFCNTIRSDIKNGQLPPIAFSTEIKEGVPEEAITDYAKEKAPLLIVMGTRGAGKKEKELIGSVTAEVLDSCRFPIFTVPEQLRFNAIHDITNVVFYASLDQTDILALDSLSRFLHGISLHVSIVSLPTKKILHPEKSLKQLQEYCTKHFHRFSVDTEQLHTDNLLLQLDRIEKKNAIDMVVVPNKKKNVFARLFNPGIAHRLLFNADIPMLVIPV